MGFSDSGVFGIWEFVGFRGVWCLGFRLPELSGIQGCFGFRDGCDSGVFVVQGSLRFGVQGFRGSGVQAFRGIWDSGVFGVWGSGIQFFLVSGVFGFRGVWKSGFLGILRCL